MDTYGLLRSNSRLNMIEWLEEDFKFPIILPKEHSFTGLLIKDSHDRIGHPIGTNATLNELNKRFWVIGARVILKKVGNECMICRFRPARASVPKMAPLPSFRLAKPLAAFRVTSVDFAGPFFTKKGIGLAKNKRYLALFTCLQTRAVHLEVDKQS